MAAKTTASIQVIARVARLLEAIAAHGGPVSLKILANTTGLHPSTAFRILASLIEHGFVERGEAGRYRFGARMLQLGDRAQSLLDLRCEARPVMERLRDLTGETVSLSVRDGDEVVYVECLAAPRVMRVERMIGWRAPLHAAASGKLFLAEDGAEACREYAATTGLPARTPHSIAEPDLLWRSLWDIGRAGYALDDGEAEAGVSCIAVPVRDAGDRLVAGLAVSALIERRQTAWIPWVVHAAAEISARLGHGVPVPAKPRSKAPIARVHS
jgi:DNA-binding IclR family transcriptional regulator